mmetsp:Transcript_48078/g.115556  ORF Transcript_48078/g.115556 Transcript_48078/m.115556 type:complete len:200 (-) Transcript_48078:144-743(-)
MRDLQWRSPVAFSLQWRSIGVHPGLMMSPGLLLLLLLVLGVRCFKMSNNGRVLLPRGPLQQLAAALLDRPAAVEVISLFLQVLSLPAPHLHCIQDDIDIRAQGSVLEIGCVLMHCCPDELALRLQQRRRGELECVAVLLHRSQDNLTIRTQLNGGVPEARTVLLHCCKDELTVRPQCSRGVFEERCVAAHGRQHNVSIR